MLSFVQMDTTEQHKESTKDDDGHFDNADPTMISALIGRYGQTRNVYNYRVKSIDSWSPIVVRLALCIRFQVEGGNFFVEREIVMRVKCHRL